MPDISSRFSISSDKDKYKDKFQFSVRNAPMFIRFTLFSFLVSLSLYVDSTYVLCAVNYDLFHLFINSYSYLAIAES